MTAIASRLPRGFSYPEINIDDVSTAWGDVVFLIFLVSMFRVQVVYDYLASCVISVLFSVYKS